MNLLTRLFKYKKVKIINAMVLLSSFFFFSCMEKEKTVSLGASVSEKKISMTSTNVEGLKVDVYLISEEAVEGELLAKALNSSGMEIGRAKQILALAKDDAKLFSFSFDSNLDSDNVAKYVLDFRKK